MSDLLAELTSLERELHHAGLICTEQRLQQLLHADFYEVGRSGRIYTREIVLRFLATQTEPLAASSDAFALKQLSSNSILLTYRSMHPSRDGKSEYAYRCSVWMRAQVDWQLIYHQGTPAAEGWN